MNAFATLNAIDVSDKVREKNNMSYLPWAWAWGEQKKLFPRSYYTIYENKDGLNYHTDGKTCWVKTGVTLVTDEGELEHIEYLPIMNMRNQSIPLANIDSMAVNKAIQRSLTKACARHGVGLYVYAGEDLPEEDAPPPPPPKKAPPKEITRTGEAKKLFDAIDAAIQKKTKGMNPEAKKAFAAELKTIAGTVNYKAVEDLEILKKLYDAYVKEN